MEQKQTKLPPEIEAKLARLDALEAEYKATLTAKEALEVALQAQEMQRHGIETGPDENGNYKVLIDLPPSGGWDIRINNGTQQYCHGQEYSVDINTLRTLKEIMHRSWKHHQDLKGGDENQYRQPVHATLSGRTGGRIR